jgi:hypothetical protein
MLIPIAEKDGRQTWINPLHVRWVRSNRGMLGGDKPGSQIGVGDPLPIETAEAPAELSARLGAALSVLLSSSAIAGIVQAGTSKQHEPPSSD